MDKKKAIKKLSKKALDTTDFGKEGKINWMLSREKKPYKCFAIGEHNGHFYFGTNLDYGAKKVPVIILDNGDTYWCWREKDEKGESIVDDEIKQKFGLNYRFELFDDCVDNLWSNDSIKKFIAGECEKQSYEDLFERIRAKNEELMYHPDKRTHDFIACDIVSNYFYPLCEAKGRTYFQAEFASGKSRQSLIYQKLSFNSLFASNISPASWERVIESTGGTLIVDNFDNIADDLKKQILQAIEVYYKKGGKNIKAAGTGFQKNNPVAFNGYSPLVINNIVGLSPVTESRCNKVLMLKTDVKNVVDVRINGKDPFWNKTKDDLHILTLQRWKEFKEVYDLLEVPEMSARDLEKSEAILCVAKLVGKKTYDRVLSYLLETNEQQSITDVQDSWEFILFDFLNSVVKEGTKSLKVAEITACVGDKIVTNPMNERKDKLKFSHYCGKVLKNIPVFRRKVIAGYVHYEIERKALTQMLKIKKLDKYVTQQHPTTPNNTNTTNNTNINNEKTPIQQHPNSPNNTNLGVVNKREVLLGVLGDVKMQSGGQQHLK